MTLSVRLDQKTRALLERLVRQRRLSRSEIVRRGIHVLAESEVIGDPYPLVHHLIGIARGAQPDLSERTGDKFRKVLSDKRNRSR